MNTLAFASFLRHLMFFLSILKLICGIIILMQGADLSELFDEKEHLPYTLQSSSFYSLDVGVDLILAWLTAIGSVVVALAVVGFLAAVWVHSKPLLNFAVGMSFLFLAPMEILMMLAMLHVISTFDIAIKHNLQDLFDSVNGFAVNYTDFDNKLFQDLRDHNLTFRGWNPVTSSNVLNRTFVDFYQITWDCCGLTGRMYWVATPPQSCCSEEMFDNCTLMWANTKSCLGVYEGLRQGFAVFEVESLFFSVFSLIFAACSLSLTRLQLKFPDGNYETDYTSSEDELNRFDI